MKTISQTIAFGKGKENTVFVGATIDTKPTIRHEGGSMLVGFLAELFKNVGSFGTGISLPGSSMHKDSIELGGHIYGRGSYTYNQCQVVDITANNPMRIKTWSSQSGGDVLKNTNAWAAGEIERGCIWLCDINGISGVPEPPNKIWVKYVTYTGATPLSGYYTYYDCYEDKAGTIPVVYTGSFANPMVAVLVADQDHYGTTYQTSRGYFSHNNFLSAWTDVGMSDRLVRINDTYMYNPVDAITTYGRYSGFTASAVTYSFPSVLHPSVTNRLTRIFTNNSGGAVNIKEVALLSGSSQNWNPTLARDVVDYTVGNGGQFTLDYDIVMSMTSEGGLTRQFAEMLYRHMSGNSREAKDIYNQSYSAVRSGNTWKCTFPGGMAMTQFYTYEGDFGLYTNAASYYGPVVGSDDGALYPLDIDNYKLGNLITEGDGGSSANQLRHFGATVDDFEIDEWNGIASFKIYRFFHNAHGSETVTIKETGLQSGTDPEVGGEATPCLWARNILTVPVDVDPGEYLKLTYTVYVSTDPWAGASAPIVLASSADAVATATFTAPVYTGAGAVTMASSADVSATATFTGP